LNATKSRAAARTVTPAAFLGKALVTVVILVFVFVFGMPIVWLLLAPTKSSTELTGQPPFSFGSRTASSGSGPATPRSTREWPSSSPSS